VRVRCYASSALPTMVAEARWNVFAGRSQRLDSLYDRVADTVRCDLKEELGFIAIFDRAFNAVREIVDRPDRRPALFVRLCMQDGGRPSGAKHLHFAELTDAEIARMDGEVQEAMTAQTTEHPQTASIAGGRGWLPRKRDRRAPGGDDA
jgi:hypothetical protein